MKSDNNNNIFEISGKICDDKIDIEGFLSGLYFLAWDHFSCYTSYLVWEHWLYCSQLLLCCYCDSSTIYSIKWLVRRAKINRSINQLWSLYQTNSNKYIIIFVLIVGLLIIYGRLVLPQWMMNDGLTRSLARRKWGRLRRMILLIWYRILRNTAGNDASHI